MNDFRMILYPYVTDGKEICAIFIESLHVKPFLGNKFGDVLFFYREDGEYSVHFSDGYDKIKVIGIDTV